MLERLSDWSIKLQINGQKMDINALIVAGKVYALSGRTGPADGFNARAAGANNDGKGSLIANFLNRTGAFIAL